MSQCSVPWWATQLWATWIPFVVDSSILLVYARCERRMARWLPWWRRYLSCLMEETEDIGLIWEYLSAAGPLSINGYPIFFSCRLMHKDDVEVVIPLINAEQDRRKEYLKG